MKKKKVKNINEKQNLNGNQNVVEELTFDSLYNELLVFFVNYITNIINDEKIAEDIVQECFIIAYKKQDTMLASSNPRGWLFAVLKNTLRNDLRIRKAISRDLILVPYDGWLNNVPDEKASEENIDFLYNDLLQYEEYNLLKKFAVDKVSQRELAEEKGISIAACKQKIYRAKIKLRKKLEKIKKY